MGEEETSSFGYKFGRKLGEELFKLSQKHNISLPLSFEVENIREEHPDKPIEYVEFTEEKYGDHHGDLRLSNRIRRGTVSADGEKHKAEWNPQTPFELTDDKISLLSIHLNSGGVLYGNYFQFFGRVVLQMHFIPPLSDITLTEDNEVMPPNEKGKRGRNYQKFLRGMNYLKDILRSHDELPHVDILYGITNERMAEIIKLKYPATVVESLKIIEDKTVYAVHLDTESIM